MPRPHPDLSREPIMMADADGHLGDILRDRLHEASGPRVAFDGLAPQFRPEDG